MIRNAELEGNIFSFDCPACGTTNSTDIEDYNPQFVDEIGNFENLMITCTNCRVMVGFNMQIPIFEAAESEGYFEYASEEDRKLREVIREIMWRRMPELQGRDREAEERAYIEENGIGVPEPEPMPGPEPEPIPIPPPVQLPDEQPPIEETPAEDAERLPIDREQLVQEVQEAIEGAIQAEEGDNKND